VTHTLRRGVIHKAYAQDVYPQIEPGSVSLLISDGPYGMAKAAWDRMKPRDLPAWYAPHIDAWGRVCAPSATVYVWGNDEGEGYLRAPMRAAGWTFRGSVVWDKGDNWPLGRAPNYGLLRSWRDITEVCAMYQREAWAPNTCAGQEIAYAAGADDRNVCRLFLVAEWEAAGLKRREADTALGTNGMAGHYFGTSQWSLPTWEAFALLAAYAQEHGHRRRRPYFLHPDAPLDDRDHLRASYDHLRASYDHLRAEYDHLRAEYEASRPPFTHPMGVGNVWRHGQVTGQERLRSGGGDALHPCQKPLAFYDRMIRASSRPGDLVLEPFGGTCRAAVAIERMQPADARRYVCVEPDEDGRDYLPAVLRSLTLDADTSTERQPGLFA